MKYNAVLDRLQNLINYTPTQSELCEVTGIKQSAMSQRASRNSDFNSDEIVILNNHYGVNLFNNTVDRIITQNNILNHTSADVIKIPYWEDLPEELKHPEYTYVLAQRTSIEQGWGLKADGLRIVPMVGDKMSNYWYPIFNGDILIVDISQDYIMGNGVYFATSKNNTRFWIREMQVLVNDDVEFKGFAHSGNTTRVLSKAQLDEVGFKVIGKVIKNVSFRL